MSCYFRHIKGSLEEAGIVITPANKKQVDQAIHQFVGVTYKNCPVVWKAIKEDLKSDGEKRQALIEQLQATLRQ
jgi:hypothetical protein